jgi:hypothetical protein
LAVGDAASFLQVSAPWAVDTRSLPVVVREGEDGAAVAARLLANRRFEGELAHADSLVVVSSAAGEKVGADLQRELAGAIGRDLRVYESTTSLEVVPPGTDASWPEGGFRHMNGGYFSVYGQPSRSHDQLLAYAIVRAEKTGFRFASAAESSVPEVGVNDWAGSVRLFAEALIMARAGLGVEAGFWDLAGPASVFARHERPELLWSALALALRDRLGGVRRLADMVWDPAAQQWQALRVPSGFRRLFAATSHRTDTGDERLVRDVNFNVPGRLLTGAAAATPPGAAPDLIAWLVEAAIDADAHGERLPQVPESGGRAARSEVQRLLINELLVNGVPRSKAQSWAADMVNRTGAAGAAFQAQLIPFTTRSADSETGPADGDPAPIDDPGAVPVVLNVPLGGGVLSALSSVLPDEPAARRAGLVVAGHLMQDQSGAPVPEDRVRAASKVSWPVAALADVSALAYLWLAEAWERLADPAHIARVLPSQPMGVVRAMVGPDLELFFSEPSHEQVIRDAVENAWRDSHPGLPADEAFGLWDAELTDDGVTAEEVLRELLRPEGVSTRLFATGAQVAEVAAEESTHHLPAVGLQMAAGWDGDAEAIRDAARAAASATVTVDAVADVVQLNRDLADSGRELAGMARLHGLLDQATWERNDVLTTAVGTALAEIFRNDVPGWLADGLAAVPPWDAFANDSVSRVGTVLTEAHAMGRPLPTTLDDLAVRLSGQWRGIDVAGLFDLPVDAVTVLWVMRPVHVLLVERTGAGLTIIDAHTPAGITLRKVTDLGQAAAVLDGPTRVVVDGDDHIVVVRPHAEPEGSVAGPSVPSRPSPFTIPGQRGLAPMPGGLPQPRFGLASVGAGTGGWVRFRPAAADGDLATPSGADAEATSPSSTAVEEAESRLRFALSGLPAGDGQTPHWVARVDDVLIALRIGPTSSYRPPQGLGDRVKRAASDIAARLGATFRTTTVHALTSLRPGHATVVWLQDPLWQEHVGLVFHDGDSLWLIETQPLDNDPQFIQFQPTGSPDNLPADLVGPIRVPISADGLLAQFDPAGGMAQERARGLLAGLRQAVVDPAGLRVPFSGEGLDSWFGVDVFGVRRPEARPSFVGDFRLDDLVTDQIVPYLEMLDLAALRSVDGRVLSPETVERRKQTVWRKPARADRVPTDMPLLLYTEWFGGPLSGTRYGDSFKANLGHMAEEAAVWGFRLVLLTDVTRDAYEQASLPGGNDDPYLRRVSDDLMWAWGSNIIVVNVWELFNADALPPDPDAIVTSEYALLELNKQTGEGYAAASDNVRALFAYVLGGIHVDSDLTFDPAALLPAREDGESRWISEIAHVISTDGFAIQRGDLVATDGSLTPGHNNAVLMSARNHPALLELLRQIATNYRRTQDDLIAENDRYGAQTRDQAEVWVRERMLRPRRFSVMVRTGPDVLIRWAERMGLSDESELPGLFSWQMLSAASWIRDVNPFAAHRRYNVAEEPGVLMRVVATLIRSLRNRYDRDLAGHWNLAPRRGDLHLTSVATVINGLPDPAAGWIAAIEFILGVPALAAMVATVTDRALTPPRIAGGPVDVAVVDLPPWLRARLGLSDQKNAGGEWIRAELTRPASIAMFPLSTDRVSPLFTEDAALVQLRRTQAERANRSRRPRAPLAEPEQPRTPHELRPPAPTEAVGDIGAPLAQHPRPAGGLTRDLHAQAAMEPDLGEEPEVVGLQLVGAGAVHAVPVWPEFHRAAVEYGLALFVLLPDGVHDGVWTYSSDLIGVLAEALPKPLGTKQPDRALLFVPRQQQAIDDFLEGLDFRPGLIMPAQPTSQNPDFNDDRRGWVQPEGWQLTLPGGESVPLGEILNAETMHTAFARFLRDQNRPVGRPSKIVDMISAMTERWSAVPLDDDSGRRQWVAPSFDERLLSRDGIEYTGFARPRKLPAGRSGRVWPLTPPVAFQLIQDGDAYHVIQRIYFRPTSVKWMSSQQLMDIEHGMAARAAEGFGTIYEGVRLPDGSRLYHHIIVVGSPEQAHRSVSIVSFGERDYSVLWSVDITPATLVHELGHMFLDDEYMDRDPFGRVIYPGDYLMGANRPFVLGLALNSNPLHFPGRMPRAAAYGQPHPANLNEWWRLISTAVEEAERERTERHAATEQGPLRWPRARFADNALNRALYEHGEHRRHTTDRRAFGWRQNGSGGVRFKPDDPLPSRGARLTSTGWKRAPDLHDDTSTVFRQGSLPRRGAWYPPEWSTDEVIYHVRVVYARAAWPENASGVELDGAKGVRLHIGEYNGVRTTVAVTGEAIWEHGRLVRDDREIIDFWPDVDQLSVGDPSIHPQLRGPQSHQTDVPPTAFNLEHVRARSYGNRTNGTGMVHRTTMDGELVHIAGVEVHETQNVDSRGTFKARVFFLDPRVKPDDPRARAWTPQMLLLPDILGSDLGVTARKWTRWYDRAENRMFPDRWTPFQVEQAILEAHRFALLFGNSEGSADDYAWVGVGNGVRIVGKTVNGRIEQANPTLEQPASGIPPFARSWPLGRWGKEFRRSYKTPSGDASNTKIRFQAWYDEHGIGYTVAMEVRVSGEHGLPLILALGKLGAQAHDPLGGADGRRVRLEFVAGSTGPELSFQDGKLHSSSPIEHVHQLLHPDDDLLSAAKRAELLDGYLQNSPAEMTPLIAGEFLKEADRREPVPNTKVAESVRSKHPRTIGDLIKARDLPTKGKLERDGESFNVAGVRVRWSTIESASGPGAKGDVVGGIHRVLSSDAADRPRLALTSRDGNRVETWLVPAGWLREDLAGLLSDVIVRSKMREDLARLLSHVIVRSEQPDQGGGYQLRKDETPLVLTVEADQLAAFEYDSRHRAEIEHHLRFDQNLEAAMADVIALASIAEQPKNIYFGYSGSTDKIPAHEGPINYILHGQYGEFEGGVFLNEYDKIADVYRGPAPVDKTKRPNLDGSASLQPQSARTGTPFTAGVHQFVSPVPGSSLLPAGTPVSPMVQRFARVALTPNPLASAGTPLSPLVQRFVPAAQSSDPFLGPYLSPVVEGFIPPRADVPLPAIDTGVSLTQPRFVPDNESRAAAAPTRVAPPPSRGGVRFVGQDASAKPWDIFDRISQDHGVRLVVVSDPSELSNLTSVMEESSAATLVLLRSQNAPGLNELLRARGASVIRPMDSRLVSAGRAPHDDALIAQGGWELLLPDGPIKLSDFILAGDELVTALENFIESKGWLLQAPGRFQAQVADMLLRWPGVELSVGNEPIWVAGTFEPALLGQAADYAGFSSATSFRLSNDVPVVPSRATVRFGLARAGNDSHIIQRIYFDVDEPVKWLTQNQLEELVHGMAARATEGLEELYRAAVLPDGSRFHQHIIVVDSPAQAHRRIRLLRPGSTPTPAAWPVDISPTVMAWMLGHPVIRPVPEMYDRDLYILDPSVRITPALTPYHEDEPAGVAGSHRISPDMLIAWWEHVSRAITTPTSALSAPLMTNATLNWGLRQHTNNRVAFDWDRLGDGGVRVNPFGVADFQRDSTFESPLDGSLWPRLFYPPEWSSDDLTYHLGVVYSRAVLSSNDLGIPLDEDHPDIRLFTGTHNGVRTTLAIRDVDDERTDAAGAIHSIINFWPEPDQTNVTDPPAHPLRTGAATIPTQLEPRNMLARGYGDRMHGTGMVHLTIHKGRPVRIPGIEVVPRSAPDVRGTYMAQVYFLDPAISPYDRRASVWNPAVLTKDEIGNRERAWSRWRPREPNRMFPNHWTAFEVETAILEAHREALVFRNIMMLNEEREYIWVGVGDGVRIIGHTVNGMILSANPTVAQAAPVLVPFPSSRHRLPDVPASDRFEVLYRNPGYRRLHSTTIRFRPWYDEAGIGYTMELSVRIANAEKEELTPSELTVIDNELRKISRSAEDELRDVSGRRVLLRLVRGEEGPRLTANRRNDGRLDGRVFLQGWPLNHVQELNVVEPVLTGPGRAEILRDRLASNFRELGPVIVGRSQFSTGSREPAADPNVSATVRTRHPLNRSDLIEAMPQPEPLTRQSEVTIRNWTLTQEAIDRQIAIVPLDHLPENPDESQRLVSVASGGSGRPQLGQITGQSDPSFVWLTPPDWTAEDIFTMAAEVLYRGHEINGQIADDIHPILLHVNQDQSVFRIEYASRFGEDIASHVQALADIDAEFDDFAVHKEVLALTAIAERPDSAYRVEDATNAADDIPAGTVLILHGRYGELEGGVFLGAEHQVLGIFADEAPVDAASSAVSLRIVAPSPEASLPPSPVERSPQVANVDLAQAPDAARRTRIPESVAKMSSLLDRASNGVPPKAVPMRLAMWRFPTGLRTSPIPDAETVDPVDWIGERLDDPAMEGVHRLANWGALRVLIQRAGQNGMVLTLERGSSDLTVYMLADGDIWRIRNGPLGAVAQLWTEPPVLLPSPEPPRMALAFNKCADPVV